MKQLSASKKRRLLSALKAYNKRYLTGRDTELDESATRLMINDFLTNVLGFLSLDEIKTEYMIRNTYADYIVQVGKKRHFVVEVKALQYELGDKHLRQAVNYAANEGIDWALLTNGKNFQFYRIHFSKPIRSTLVFNIDLSDKASLRKSVDVLQFLTTDLISERELGVLWNRVSALDPANLARLIMSKSIVGSLRRLLKRSYKDRFSDEEVANALRKVIGERLEGAEEIKVRNRAKRRKRRGKTEKAESAVAAQSGSV